MARSLLFKPANRFFFNQSSASILPTYSHHHSVLMLVYQRSQGLRDVRTFALQIRHRVLSWALFQVIAKGAIGQCSSSSCFLPLPLLPASSFSRHGSLIVCSTLPSFESCHSILPSVSTNKTIPNKCLFPSVLHIGLGLDSPDVPSSCSGVWDPWSIELPIQ